MYIRKFAIPLFVVESIPDDELVRNREPHIVRHKVHLTRGGFVQ